MPGEEVGGGFAGRELGNLDANVSAKKTEPMRSAKANANFFGRSPRDPTKANRAARGMKYEMAWDKAGTAKFQAGTVIREIEDSALE